MMKRGLSCVYAWACEIFDAIFLPPERARRTARRSIHDIALAPRVHMLLDEEITTLTRYRDPVVADLIQSLKYDDTPHAACLGAALLADYLREEIAQAGLFSQREIILIPVPLHTRRLHERGFNQIERVLAQLPKEYSDGTSSRIELRALERRTYHTPQTKLSRRARIKNVEGAFALTEPELVRERHVFLIDDVATTGATLKSAGACIKQAGARVTLIALARA